MNKVILLLLISVSAVVAQKKPTDEQTRWAQQASQITITRDRWGIPHISGKTDADAVFGMLYTQCEDDFERVERNYIVATARLAEAEGENFIYNDLRQRLFLDTLQAIALFKTSPDWMKKVCNAFADGINYYLYTHPQTKPKVIKRFQPWMPLLFSEGSIGGDIESVSIKEIKEFYGKVPDNTKEVIHDDGIEREPGGSNGFVIAPSRSASGNALLLINPHTSFYFRSELHMTSQEGLNAYGAVTWGQFFIYQGFNEHCGWMHPSTQTDVIDEYKETIIKQGSKLAYQYGKEKRPLPGKKVTIRYKTDKGLASKDFITYATHHGPVVANRDGKWITTKLMNDPINALTQSYMRTKAAGLEDYKNNMMLRTNSSNNTLFADDKGNIAYWHGDFIPRRDTRFDWDLPVDGSDPATEWKGLHTLDEIVHIYNPSSGWIQNCNATPFTAAGSSSPRKEDYPTYMAPESDNPRQLHAVRVLKDEKAFTLDKLITAAYDSYLPGFEGLIPSLVKSFDALAESNDTLKMKYNEPMQFLRTWDFRFAGSSIPTTLAIYWAQRLRMDVAARIKPSNDQMAVLNFLEHETTPEEKMKALAGIVKELQRDFGTWKMAWGEVNRFQRITGKIESVFDDNKPSFAVPFTSANWGSLAAYGSRKFPGTKKMYGYVGNSFVAVVEFGKKVKARTVVTGGASADPSSPHFNDQGEMYAQFRFKDVLFYPEDLKGNTEKVYHPGEQ